MVATITQLQKSRIFYCIFVTVTQNEIWNNPMTYFKLSESLDKMIFETIYKLICH